MVLLDDKVYEYLTSDPYLVRMGFIDNLRKHSSGCAVFQKNWKKPLIKTTGCDPISRRLLASLARFVSAR